MSIKVAIVEDDEQVRENLAELIRETKGFECTGTYASGEQALESLPRRRVDVVLMDVNLPGMSGVECVRRLKSVLPDVPVVILARLPQDDLQQAARPLAHRGRDEVLQVIVPNTPIRGDGVPRATD